METNRTLVLLGGGELREKTTLSIDAFCARKAKLHAGDKRAYGLFIGTASHDSMPYFNTFRKTYTGEFDIKADCALTVYGEMNYEKIAGKFQKADLIYIGGGDTVFMLDKWKTFGITDLLLDAYNRGVVIVGLSAGAICFFDVMYTDSPSVCGDETYRFHKGLGVLDGVACPHYEIRKPDFTAAFSKNDFQTAIAIEGDAAAVYENERLKGSLSSGGKAYVIRNNNGNLERFLIENYIEE